jgi:hypothetical protein
MKTKARKTKREVQVEVRRHPRLPETHFIGVVTTRRGLCYCCTWAGEVSEETVRQTWAKDRKAFDPYCL